MNVNDGRIEDLGMLKNQFASGEEKPEDWVVLPKGATPEQLLFLQTKSLNRFERRALIAMLRNGGNISMEAMRIKLFEMRDKNQD